MSGIISARAGWRHDKIVAYRMTYPKDPHSCVPVKLGEEPYEPWRFVSLESRFREYAARLGLDTSRAWYVPETQAVAGGRQNLSRLLIPGEGPEYVKIAFYS